MEVSCKELFMVQYMEKLKTNSDTNHIHWRHKYDLHVPRTNYYKYLKGVYYTGIKLFSIFPPYTCI